jgi:hypothetical protein
MFLSAEGGALALQFSGKDLMHNYAGVGRLPDEAKVRSGFHCARETIVLEKRGRSLCWRG